MRAHVGGFVVHVLLLLVLFLAAIDTIFLFSGKLFWLEIVIIAGLIVMASVGAGRYASQGSRALLFVYGVTLLDILVLSSIVREVFWLPLVLTALGTIISLRNKRKPQDFSDVHVEEVKPEPMGPEMLAGVKEPIVESRVITEKPARKTRSKKRVRKKRK